MIKPFADTHRAIGASDLFGALASILCLVHCLITPLIFVVKTSAISCTDSSTFWWRMVDYVFIIISFIAYYTAKFTVLTWMPYVLYGCWIVLTILILNESFHFISIPHYLIHVPAIGLIVLHLFNRNHCQCAGDTCCVTNHFH